MPILLIAAFLTGVLYAFGYPNFLNEGFAPFAPVAFIGIMAILPNIPRTRWRLVAVLLHQIGFQVTGFYWVGHTLQEFGGLSPAASYLMGLGLAPVLNPALWGWVFWLKWRHRVPGQDFWPLPLQIFIAAVLMTTFEALIPQQFPVYAGHVWMQHGPWLRWAPFGGVSLYSFFTWWLIFALLPLARRSRPAISGLVAVAIFLISHAFMPPLNNAPREKSLNIRVVQANVGNLLKTESESGDPMAVSDVVERYRQLSLVESPQKLDLLVWPETAYPYPFRSDLLKKGEDTLPEVFHEVLARTNAEILLGGYDSLADDPYSDRFETDYNAAFLMGSDGNLSQVYRKHILIPFGETLPFGPLNRPLSRVLPAVSFFARGRDFSLFQTKNGATFVVPICYEILQGSFIAHLLNGTGKPADFMVNLTNDSWYGDTAEPAQHLFLAKWRAVEFQRPIVRSTNTGITTVIYPDGQEGRRLLVGQKDVLDVRLHLPQVPRPTFYEKWGLWGLMALWVLLAAVFSADWWRQNRRGTNRASVERL